MLNESIARIVYREDIFRQFSGWGKVFDNHHPLKVEIGCGKDDSLIERAQRESLYNFVGIESDAGVAYRLESKIRRSRITNVRVIAFDGPHAVKNLFLPDTVHTFYIQFPDPWPKKRHAKRRILKDDFIKIIYEKLVPMGTLFIATDVDLVAELALSTIQRVGGFKNKSMDGAYLHEKPFSQLTLYERKFLKEGKRIYYLQFDKVLD